MQLLCAANTILKVLHKAATTAVTTFQALGQSHAPRAAWIAVQKYQYEDRMPKVTCKGIRRTSAAGLALPVCSRYSKLHHRLCQRVNCLSAALPSAFCC